MRTESERRHFLLDLRLNLLFELIVGLIFEVIFDSRFGKSIAKKLLDEEQWMYDRYYERAAME